MTTKTIFTVPDIVCGGCADSIKNALGKIPGIEQVEVEVATKVVTIQHAEEVSRDKLTEVLDDAGFTAE